LRPSEILLGAIFAACISFQLFVPPSIGLSNNGDFAKMVGRFALGPASMDTSDEYRYFTAHWVYDRSYQWVSNDRSSELLPIGAAVTIGWWFSTHEFDIRILGAIHALLWVSCFVAFLSLLRRMYGRRSYVTGIAALFIFTDVSYVAYCNSFYTDVAAFLFLAWAFVLWLHFMNGERATPALFLLFATSAVLSVSSKPQHAPLSVFWCTLAAIAAMSFQGTWRRTGALFVAAAILVAAIITFSLMPGGVKGPEAFDVIFISVLHNSPSATDDLRELGLGPEYLRYIDHWPHPTFPDPAANLEWWNDFSKRTGHTRIAQFYLRHPWRAATIVYRALHDSAYRRRSGWGNYERQSGLPPGKETKSFGWWSALRSALFHIAPWHIVVWYAAVIGTGIWLAIRQRTTTLSRMGLFAVLLAGMGLTELGVAALADVGETERHLFLFHVITDFTIVLAIAWAEWVFQGRASLRARS
jgi:hypothetical protein